MNATATADGTLEEQVRDVANDADELVDALEGTDYAEDAQRAAMRLTRVANELALEDAAASNGVDVP